MKGMQGSKAVQGTARLYLPGHVAGTAAGSESAGQHAEQVKRGQAAKGRGTGPRPRVRRGPLSLPHPRLAAVPSSIVSSSPSFLASACPQHPLD